MAKKIAKKLAEANGEGDVAEKPKGRQQVLEGDGFPKPLSESLCDSRDQYLASMRAHAKTGKKKAECEQDLIEKMHAEEVTRIPLDGENKYFEIEAPEKIKTKTVPKEQRDQRAARENSAA